LKGEGSSIPARRWIEARFAISPYSRSALRSAANRDLLRRLLGEHVTDASRAQLAKQVVEHLELSGFEIDESAQVMTKKPPTHGHG
jgi:hypothetical protein